MNRTKVKESSNTGYLENRDNAISTWKIFKIIVLLAGLGFFVFSCIVLSIPVIKGIATVSEYITSMIGMTAIIVIGMCLSLIGPALLRDSAEGHNNKDEQSELTSW